MTLWSRRAFGTSLLALPALGLGGLGKARADAPAVLVARPGMAQLAPPEYPATAIWGYDGTVPGPVLRLPQGARVQQRFSQ